MLKKLQKIGVSLIVVELIVQLSMPLFSNISFFNQNKSIAAETITGMSDNRFKYYFNSDRTGIIITKYIGEDTDVVIPSKIDGYNVKGIGAECFYNCTNLTSVEIPEGVTEIGFGAFSGCSSLINIKIPKTLTNIGSDAFFGCSSLTNIEIPSNVTSIRNYAFEGCSGLTSIEIPNSVTSIGNSAFSGCSSLTNIKIPESVTNIGEWAFSYCNNLTSIKIPNGVTSISKGVFSQCSSLSSVEIPERITSIGYDAFFECTSLENIRIPEEVTNIERNAFLRCSSLTSIEIPNGVINIEDRTFEGCSNLTNIEIPEEVTQIGSDVFYLDKKVIIKCKSNSVAHQYATENSINVDLDDNAPTYEIKYSETKPTQNNIEVTITFNEEIRKVDGWTLSEDRKTLTKTFTENKTEEIEIKDLVGNSETIQVKVSNIDRIPPELTATYSETKITNQNVIVTITSNEEVQAVEGWKLSEDKKILTKTYEANATEIVKVKDIAGNEAIAEIKIENIDKIAPTVTVSYSTINPTNGNVIVTITANEKVQGIDGWTLSNNEKILTRTYNANSTENITVKDIAGNEAIAEIKIENIDKIAPKLNVEYSTTDLTNQNVIVTITSNEEVQAVEGWKLSEDKKILTKTYEANVTENITLKDIAGNETVAEIKIENIDNIAPELNIEYSTKALTNGDVIVTITANEEVQVLSGWTLSEDKKILTKTYSANATENIRVKDILGNEAVAEVKIENIDKVAPIVSVSYSTKALTNGDVIVTITANEEVQALSGWTLSENKKILTKKYSANATENIKVKDIAGNETVAEVKIENIDKVAPIVSVSYSTKALTNGDVIVTITANEEVQAVEGWTLSEDRKSLTKTYSANVTETVKVKDIAGNEAITEIKIENIDKIAPKIEKIKDGEVYTSVTLRVTDENLKTVELKKNEEKIEYLDGMQIKEQGEYEIIATDKVGNITKISFKIVEKAEMTVTKYKIDEENKYITSVKVGETKENIISNIKSNIEYKITTKENKEVTNETIATGMKIVFTTGENYEIVVTGDINGDGKISVTDLTKMKKALIGKETIEGCYKEAADVNSDGKITITDLARMKRALVGLTQL